MSTTSARRSSGRLTSDCRAAYHCSRNPHRTLTNVQLHTPGAGDISQATMELHVLSQSPVHPRTITIHLTHIPTYAHAGGAPHAVVCVVQTLVQLGVQRTDKHLIHTLYTHPPAGGTPHAVVCVVQALVQLGVQRAAGGVGQLGPSNLEEGGREGGRTGHMYDVAVGLSDRWGEDSSRCLPPAPVLSEPAAKQPPCAARAFGAQRRASSHGRRVLWHSTLPAPPFLVQALTVIFLSPRPSAAAAPSRSPPPAARPCNPCQSPPLLNPHANTHAPLTHAHLQQLLHHVARRQPHVGVPVLIQAGGQQRQ